ncbi:MAG: hypothetical protein CM15mP109_13970 [Candidatus Dadabacteria bacterium]|nr:MAG: hypothetical protein CM15mP109_13970 [Candidatus Dadabacteria bacterium]
MLKDLGVTNQVVLEKNKVGDSFDKWPKEMRLITPSFTTNFYGHLDLNAIVSATSPAFTLRAEHPTGKQYAHYLRAVSDYCELPIVEDSNVEKISYSNNAFKLKINGTDLIESRF